MDEIRSSIAKDADLLSKLEGMWKSDAGSEELTAAIREAGIDIQAEQVETMLSEIQEKRAKVIATQELDDEALDQVAGGGTGNDCSHADDCDKDFKDRDFWGKERCDYQNYCDEYYVGACYSSVN